MRKLLVLIKKILTNKVFFYLATRYFTYAIQFTISFFVAAKLEPYYFGIWSFVLLLLNYYSLINFGISNSVNVLLVQYKEDTHKTDNIIKTSLFLVGGVCALIVLFTVYYYGIGVAFFDKYSLKPFLYLISIIGILTHYNNLLSTIVRVKNDIFKVAFFQSIIPLLCFIALFLAKESTLMFLLLFAYIIGNIASIILFVTDKRISYQGRCNREDAKLILNKGAFLFIYNLAFYLIIISTKTIISFYFSVEEYGLFAFSYTLANTVLLLLNAFSFIIFPKLIDKLSSKNINEIQCNIDLIRNNYITLAHGLLYCVIALYPLFLLLLPKYAGTIPLFHFIALTTLMSVNSFGFSTYLLAQNKEKLMSILAFGALLTNIVGVLLMVLVMKKSYEYAILATLLTYCIYTLLTVYFGKRILSKRVLIKDLLSDFLPWNLFLPFLFSLSIAIIGNYSVALNIFCAVLFLLLNLKEITKIKNTIKRLINEPSIINI